MKVKIINGTAVYKGKEYTAKDGVIDLPESAVKSLMAATTTDVEEVIEVPAAEEVATAATTTDVNPNNEGTVKWYRYELDAMGVDFDSEARKDELVNLYVQNARAEAPA